MNFLGIDYGTKRIGLSEGDDELKLAVPLEAIMVGAMDDAIKEIASMVFRKKIGNIVVGYPLNMDDSIGFKAREVDDFIKKLATMVSVPILRIDERLTSETVCDAQKRRSKKNRLKHRKTGVIDSASATIILQDYFDGAGVILS